MHLVSLQPSPRSGSRDVGRKVVKFTDNASTMQRSIQCCYCRQGVVIYVINPFAGELLFSGLDEYYLIDVLPYSDDRAGQSCTLTTQTVIKDG